MACVVSTSVVQARASKAQYLYLVRHDICEQVYLRDLAAWILVALMVNGVVSKLYMQCDTMTASLSIK